MKNVNNHEIEEKQINELVEKEAELIRNKNVDKLMLLFAKDTLSFDVIDPLQYKGISGTKERMEGWFSTFDGPIGIDSSEMEVTTSENIAFTHCLRHVNAIKVDGTRLEMWWRQTTCYSKIDGNWLIVHRHSSVPFNVDNGYASTGLKPDSENPSLENKQKISFYTIIHQYFSAYENKDRNVIEGLLSDDFTFTSPYDDHINTFIYFQRCWPFSEQQPEFFRIEKLFEKGDEVFVQYVCKPKSGIEFRNVELFRISENKIKEITVYFGALPVELTRKGEPG
jgi:ketosteroid isomerase-like protein